MDTKSKRVVLFGELLMRLETPGHKRFVQAEQFDIAYTGGEANAGVALVNFGAEGFLLAAVPDNDVGLACVQQMRRFGLDTSFVQRRGPRLGTFFLETGVAQRPTKVIYDRAGSSFSLFKPGDVRWQELLAGKDWLHFTGTAPALSDEVAALTREGCVEAKKQGLTVSCDLNYRSALWSVDKACEVLQDLVKYVDVLIVNEEHAREILDVSVRDSERDLECFDGRRYEGMSRSLRERYGLSHVGITVRSGELADETSVAAFLDDGSQWHMSRRYDIRVVDRIGGGDAFAGGLIYALLENWKVERAVEFAVAAGCLKHSVPGDLGHMSRDEVFTLMREANAGRVQR